MAKPEKKEEKKGILIDPKVIEALLVAEGTSNRTAVNDVCNQIREIAEKQGYAKF